LRSELQRVVADRGRVWIGILKAAKPAPGGQVRVFTDPQLLQARPGTVPFQQAVPVNTLVYAFEAAPQQPTLPQRYLGQFKVTAVGEQNATLIPTETLTPAEEQRLAAPAPWMLFELMPVDSHQAFSGLPPADLAALLPKESLPDYERTGSKALPDDAPESVWTRVEFTKQQELDSDAGKVTYEPGEGLLVDHPSAAQLIASGAAKEAPDAQGVAHYYQRPLRDYAFLFRELYGQRRSLQAELAQAKVDLAGIQYTLDQAQKEGQFLQATIADLRSDLQKIQQDAAAAQTYAQTLEGQLQGLQKSVGDLAQANRELAARLASAQLQAAERIDRQTSLAR
jgi:hypothetical protein